MVVKVIQRFPFLPFSEVISHTFRHLVLSPRSRYAGVVNHGESKRHGRLDAMRKEESTYASRTESQYREPVRFRLIFPVFVNKLRTFSLWIS